MREPTDLEYRRRILSISDWLRLVDDRAVWNTRWRARRQYRDGVHQQIRWWPRRSKVSGGEEEVKRESSQLSGEQMETQEGPRLASWQKYVVSSLGLAMLFSLVFFVFSGFSLGMGIAGFVIGALFGFLMSLAAAGNAQ